MFAGSSRKTPKQGLDFEKTISEELYEARNESSEDSQSDCIDKL
jgi:hypothetical protein